MNKMIDCHYHFRRAEDAATEDCPWCRIEELENNKDAWKAEAIKRAGGGVRERVRRGAVKKEWCKKCGGTKHIQEQDDRGKYLCATGGMPIILDCPDCAVRKEQGDE